MNQPCRVEVVDRFGHLVKDELAMLLGQDVFADERVEVDVHMLKDQVNVPVILSLDNLLKTDYVRVRELHQKHNFSIRSLSVSRIIKSVEIFLERLDFPALTIYHFPDMAISAAADFFDDLKAGHNVSLHFFAHPDIIIIGLVTIESGDNHKLLSII